MLDDVQLLSEHCRCSIVRCGEGICQLCRELKSRFPEIDQVYRIHIHVHSPHNSHQPIIQVVVGTLLSSIYILSSTLHSSILHGRNSRRSYPSVKSRMLENHQVGILLTITSAWSLRWLGLGIQDGCDVTPFVERVRWTMDGGRWTKLLPRSQVPRWVSRRDG